MAKPRSLDPKEDEDAFKGGKNPWIKCDRTESGHMTVWCDTKGATYVFNAHQSGTYSLVKHDGTSTSVSVGDIEQYGKGGMTLTVDENQDVKLHGHSRLVMGGGSYVEIAGDGAIGVAGDTTVFSKGNMNAHVDNLYFGCKGNAKFNVEGDMLMDVKGSMKSTVGQDQTNDVSGDQKHDVGGDTKLDTNKYNIKADIKHKGDNTQSGTHVDSNGTHC